MKANVDPPQSRSARQREQKQKGEETYRELRNHTVRLLPAAPQREAGRHIVLTERDRALLTDVHRHGFLTAEHVTLVYFPPPSGQRVSHCSASYLRLRELWASRFIDRVQRPVSPAIGGSRPLLHALGPRGVAVVAAHLGEGEPAVRRRRLDRLNDTFVDHDLKATDLWATLTVHLRQTRIRSWRWTTERELRARAERAEDPRTRRPVAFLPDGLAELTYPDGQRQTLVVEIDNGTHDLDAFGRKLRAFELFLAQGRFGRAWRAGPFEVLVLTTSEARLAHLWEVARRTVVRERWPDYAFATFAVLDPARFASHDWLTLAGEHTALLYRDAYVAELDETGDAASPAGPVSPAGISRSPGASGLSTAFGSFVGDSSGNAAGPAGVFRSSVRGREAA